MTKRVYKQYSFLGNLLVEHTKKHNKNKSTTTENNSRYAFPTTKPQAPTSKSSKKQAVSQASSRAVLSGTVSSVESNKKYQTVTEQVTRFATEPGHTIKEVRRVCYVRAVNHFFQRLPIVRNNTIPIIIASIAAIRNTS